jgi:hypothetical protein
MESAYLEAWRASNASNALLKEALHLGFLAEGGLDDFSLEALGGDNHSFDPEEQKRVYADAEAEDIQADQQASILILMADDALQRYAGSLFGKAPGLDPGYGPECRGVRLTTLLRAGTNTLRHVSEWDAMFTTLPYPTFDFSNKEHQKDLRFQPMRSIQVLQKAFGYAINDFVRGPVSWAVVVSVDGQYGTAKPDYARFESTLIAAARDIAVAKSSAASKQLDDELRRLALLV